MSTRQFSRRTWLRAATGAALALPFLPSLCTRPVRAQERSFPKRLVLMYTPNGVIHDAWWPQNVVSEREFTLGPIHEPLLTHKNRLVFLGGLTLASAESGPGGPHQRGIGALFTNTSLQTGEFEDGCGAKAGWASGISVDQRIAAVVGTESPLSSLQLGVRATENDVQGRIAYAGAGQPLPPLNTPRDTYNRVFNRFIAPTTPDLVTEQRSVLDAVSKEFGALSSRLSATDRQTLDTHLTLVRDLERRLALSVPTAPTCTVPDVPPALDENSELDMARIGELQIDLLAAAFSCDITRVATFQVSTALNHIRYPFAESMEEGHALSHAGESDAKAKEQLIRRARWHASLAARLFDRLALIPEGDGSVLDNTLFLWGNEVSKGTTHAHDNMPFVIAGGGWAFETGRYVKHDGKAHADLLLAVLRAMGVPDEKFGNPDFCTGPLAI
jgi:Protein of unknown function (DUF1552)